MKITSQTGETATTVKVEPSKPSALAIVAGFVLFIVGAAGLIADYTIAIANKQSPHIAHISIYAGFCLLGVIAAFGQYVIPRINQLLIVVGNSSLPVVGGRRATDPKAPGAKDDTP